MMAGSLPGGASAVSETIAACDTYTLQGYALSQAILGNTPPPYGLDDAICNMRIIDALVKSGQSAQWKSV
jgi:hypothetical protein